MPDRLLTDRGRERAWSWRRGRPPAPPRDRHRRPVPLRNVELTVPYFHSGKVWNLEQAVAIMGVGEFGKELTL
jgi:cytochrome c peroxidase